MCENVKSEATQLTPERKCFYMLRLIMLLVKTRRHCPYFKSSIFASLTTPDVAEVGTLLRL